MASMYDVPIELTEIFRKDTRLNEIRTKQHGDFPRIDAYPAITVELQTFDKKLISIGAAHVTLKIQVALYVPLTDYSKDTEKHGELINQIEAVLRDNTTVGGYTLEYPPLMTGGRCGVVGRPAEANVPLIAAFLMITARKQEAVK